MRSMLHVLGGVAVAGAVAAGATALTGSGLTNSASDTFVGGQITQNVTGATVNSITYTYAAGDTTKTHTIGATFSLSGAAGKAFTMTAGGGTLTTATQWYCTSGSNTTASVAASGTVTVTTGATSSLSCITADNSGTAAGYYADLSTMSVQVA